MWHKFDRFEALKLSSKLLKDEEPNLLKIEEEAYL
jgi:hypothetical protein